MIFPVITLITSLLLASVAGWFSITGMVTILAGQAIAALILGVTLEAGKLVTISWLYRNWENSPWKLKIPLMYFTVALMSITSMGVYGYLAQAHIQQGASTVNNAARVEQIDLQMARAQSLMADNDKVIAQLDNAVNSLITKDRTDRALVIKRSQDAQRRSLKADSDKIQLQINQFNDEKFKLQAEVRALQLEVGPIRYIAQLIYGEGAGDTATLEAAVRLFAILIVTTLDPLAITLLIAANHSLLRIKNQQSDPPSPTVPASPPPEPGPVVHQVVPPPEPEPPTRDASPPPEPVPTVPEQVTQPDVGPDTEPEPVPIVPVVITESAAPPQPTLLLTYHAPQHIDTLHSAVDEEITVCSDEFIHEEIDVSETDPQLVPAPRPWLVQEDSLRELLGDSHQPHFVAQRVVDDNPKQVALPAEPKEDKYPRTFSWLTEFKRTP